MTRSNDFDVKASTDRPFGAGLIWSGIGIIGCFLGALAAWSLLAPIESAVVAPGVVSVESNRKTIQHLEGGIVDAILVHEGDRVKTGDLLIRLRETQRASTRNQLRAQYHEARATEARLMAERDGKPEVVYPAELRLLVAEPGVQAAMAGQDSVFRSRSKLLDERTAVLGQRISSLADEIVGLKGQIKSSRKQMALIEDELAGVSKLYSKELIGKPRLLALQRRKAEIEGAISQYRSEIARTNQQIQESRLRIAELRASTTTEVVEQLRIVTARVYELRQQLTAAEDVLTRTEIRSPIDGIVVGLKVHTRGGVIGAGQSLLDIVPVNDKLVVEASIDPRDIDQVEAGMQAHVELTAFNRRTRTPIPGAVKTVSADRLTDPQSGLSYYLARIELRLESPEVKIAALQPGMIADVMIRTGTRTPVDYLLMPITRSLGRALREN